MNKKVMTAMSGGVDSSAAALLLMQQGYDICGVTLSLFESDQVQDTAGRDAAEVCAALGIEHHIIDMKAQFKRDVIDRFAAGYKSGETPNPCVECNRNIKFSGVLYIAEKLGFDMIATGHYVIREYDDAAKRYILRRAVDPQKDQSYVLYVLTQSQIEKTLFPLGGLSKSEIRAIAEAHNLSTAHKKESQDICFIPDGDYGKFLTEKLGVISPGGSFVDVDGKPLGKHEGLIRYTLGQRRGLGVAADRRLFVLSKNMAENTITLGDEPLLFKSKMAVRDVNWVSVAQPAASIRAQVKARYRQSAQPAWIHPTEKGVVVEFDAPQRALTTGQAAVFYDGDVMLGGGTIDSAE